MKKNLMFVVAPMVLLMGSLSSCNNNATLSNIDASCNGLFKVGEQIKKTDIKVTATYSDNSSKDVTDWTCAEFTDDAYTFKDEDVGTKEFSIAYSGKTTTLEVTVNKKETGYTISLSETSKTLNVNDTFNLVATINENNNDEPTLFWSTSGDIQVVSLEKVSNKERKVTAKKEGTCSINVGCTGGNTVKCEISVESGVIHVTGVTLDKTSATLTVGNSETLTPTVTPSDATDKSVSWSSSDPNVAKVEDGKVTAIKEGDATITVTTTDGSKTDTCKVIVEAKEVLATYDYYGYNDEEVEIADPESTEITHFKIFCNNKDTCTKAIIPAKYKNKPVTGFRIEIVGEEPHEFEEGAFDSCEYLKEVEFEEPENIKAIDNYAFANCPALESIDLDGITTIGESSFYDCTSLLDINFPASITSVGEDAFGILESTIYRTVTVNNKYIANSSCGYAGDPNIFSCASKVNVINTVTPKDDCYLSNNYYKNEASNDDYVVYERKIFNGEIIEDTDNIIISLEDQGKYFTYGDFVIPATLDGKFVGYGIAGKTYNVTQINTGGMENLWSSSITISEGITEIGSRAFCNCTSLETINFPKSISTIKSKLFGDNDENLANLNYAGTIAEWKKVDRASDWHYNIHLETITCTDGECGLDDK